VNIATASPPDIRSYLERDDRVILPFGSIENNGPHLPLASDTIAADAVAQEASRRTGVALAPTIPWGSSSVNMGFAGTMTLSTSLLEQLIEELCRSLALHGFRRFVVISGHYENVWPAASAAERLRDRGLLVGQVDLWRTVEKHCRDLARTRAMPFGHGGELMTSVLLGADPESVKRDRMAPETPPESYGLKTYRSYPEVMGFAAWDEVSESGSVGDPREATEEVGREVISRVAAIVVELLEDLRQAPLPAVRPW
jgi:creatinine amidohydrolase